MARRKAQGPTLSFFAFQDIITSVVGILVLITLIMIVELVTRTRSSSQVQRDYEDTFSSTIADLKSQLTLLENRSSQLDEVASKMGNVQAFNKDEVEKELQASIRLFNEQISVTEEKNRKIQNVIEQQEKTKRKLENEMVNRSSDQQELEGLLKQLKAIDSKIDELATDTPMVYKSMNLMGRTIVVVEIHPKKLVILDLVNDRREEITSKDIEGAFKTWVRRRSVDKVHFLLLVRPYSTEIFHAIRGVMESSNASYGYDLADQNRNLKLRSEVGK